MKNVFATLCTLSVLGACAAPDEGGLHAPVINERSPAGATTGTLVDLRGAGFGDRPGKVAVESLQAKVVAWSDSHIQFRALTAGDSVCGNIQVTTGDGEKSNVMPLVAGEHDFWIPWNGAPRARANHAAVWTGREMIIWGGGQRGARYNPATDSWVPISTVSEPQSQHQVWAVWTGTEMFAAGIQIDDYGHSYEAGLYDPMTDKWRRVSQKGAPKGGNGATYVWTGQEIITWGGLNPLDTGRKYDPASDTWSGMNQGPRAKEIRRSFHAAVWTGSEMIVWGGSVTMPPANGFYVPPVYLRGSAYNPKSDEWRDLNKQDDTPPGVDNPLVVWTGSKLVVWGLVTDGNINKVKAAASIYDPKTDFWTRTQTPGAPVGREDSKAVWTGSEILIWGGRDHGGPHDYDRVLSSGAKFNVKSLTWSSMTPSDDPAARRLHTSVWTGKELIVWGGATMEDSETFNTGARYDPAADRWIAFKADDIGPSAPGGKSVWTGSEMLIWGAQSEPSHGLASSRYNPATDTWSPIATSGAPQIRARFSALWTGREMLIFGGIFTDYYYGGMNTVLGVYRNALQTGGKYNPATDSWSDIPQAPEKRYDHGAIWTGDKMIVWGGSLENDAGYAEVVTSGLAFDPVADSWSPIASAGAPDLYMSVTVVWTGKEMIAYGLTAGTHVATGGRYSPSFDRWTPVAGSPVAGGYGVWAGDRLVVAAVTSDDQKLESAFDNIRLAEYSPAQDRWTLIHEGPNLATSGYEIFGGTEGFWTGEKVIFLGEVSSKSLGFTYTPKSQKLAELGRDCSQIISVPIRSLTDWELEYSAVWTGERLLVWGANGGASYVP